MRLDTAIRGLKRVALAESFHSAWVCQIGLFAGMLPWIILLSAFVSALKSSEDLGGGDLVFGVAFGLVLGCAVTAPLVWILGVAAKHIQAYADAWRNLTFPSRVKTHIGKILVVIIAALPGFPALLSFGVIGCVARSLGEKTLRRVQIGSDARTPPIPLLDFLRTYPLWQMPVSKESRKAYVRATRVLFLEFGGILAGIWIVAELIVFAATPSSEVPEVNVWARSFIPYLIALAVQCLLSLRLVDDMQKNRALVVTSLDDFEIGDPRPPILLLRSFEDERQLTSSNSMRFLNTTRLLGFSFLHRRATSYTGTADSFGYEAVSLVGVAEIISGTMSNAVPSGTTVLS